MYFIIRSLRSDSGAHANARRENPIFKPQFSLLQLRATWETALFRGVAFQGVSGPPGSAP
ncbi:hypothetical protein GCM10011578_087920 [Streptomyces fuscichromogenes]|uniref:Uncharacterized protein n=1 Tax=Streptomyces fuscichromogenes TaxID=1324013 RepID=A0A917XNK6_9ACTN|nr:hypothetical protein GCM10011578_087920 [Streptomyces fuscichromogenes]